MGRLDSFNLEEKGKICTSWACVFPYFFRVSEMSIEKTLVKRRLILEVPFLLLQLPAVFQSM